MPVAQERPAFADRVRLVHRLRDTLEPLGPPDAQRTAEPGGVEALEARTGFQPAGGPAVVVVGRQVARELGHPSTASEVVLLLTRSPECVVDGRVRLYGPDLDALPRGVPVPYGQVVVVAVGPSAAPDPFALERAQHLTNRLPGWMSRTVPGRLWVRVGASALSRGLSLLDVGEALVAVLRQGFAEVEAVEVVLVTQREAALVALGPVAQEARILAGQHKKLVLAPDGELECPDLDCDDCDEREVCDALRDVIIKRRRRS